MVECLAVVLAGGQGTRIRHLLPEIPKPLAPVAGRPFLEWVTRYLYQQGIRQIVYSTGHYAEKVDQFASSVLLPGLDIRCAQEAEPLGTAGGFLNALHRSDHRFENALVLNGDSLVLADLAPLLSALINNKADGAILGVRVEDAGRFGSLDVDATGLLRGFMEKRPGVGLINGGIYIFGHKAVSGFPNRAPLSFEFDVFPTMVASGARIKVVPCSAPFLDIGTEESLAAAGKFINNNMRWFE